MKLGGDPADARAMPEDSASRLILRGLGIAVLLLLFQYHGASFVPSGLAPAGGHPTTRNRRRMSQASALHSTLCVSRPRSENGFRKQTHCPMGHPIRNS